LADDRLGRVLDQLYLAGLTQLFVSIALKAAAKYGVATDTVHLDSSSDTLMVADSALYSADNLKLLQGLRWISRVKVYTYNNG
jgi:hypothetical protein